MNIEDIKDFIRNRALRCAGSCSSQGSMEFNILNELYFDLFGEPAVNTIPQYDNLAIKVNHIENGHEYVDLGLPSGTLWATCNVGANKPEEYGGYYAFGEISSKKNYDWDTYLDGDILRASDCGTDKDILQNMTNITASAEYDTAKVNWGGKWRMPTHAQQKELLNRCYWVWTDSYNNSNVGGYIVYKAKNSWDKGKRIYKYETPHLSYSLEDVHIFLPAAGVHSNPGHNGYYWSSSLNAGYLSDAWYMFFSSVGVLDNFSHRYNGFTIRPVFNQKS